MLFQKMENQERKLLQCGGLQRLSGLLTACQYERLEYLVPVQLLEPMAC